MYFPSILFGVSLAFLAAEANPIVPRAASSSADALTILCAALSTNNPVYSSDCLKAPASKSSAPNSSASKSTKKATHIASSPTITKAASPSKTKSILSLKTDMVNGVVNACVKNSIDGSGVTWCASSYPVTTITSIRDARPSISIPTTARPASGCVVVPMGTFTGAPYCTCANGGGAAVQYGVRTGTSMATVTTSSWCQNPTTTGAQSTPSGYLILPPNPTSIPYLQPPTNPDCKDGTLLNSICWDVLDLSTYIQWWWMENNKTMVNVKTGTSSTTMCGNLGFSTCFIALATPYGQWNCSSVNINNNCGPNPSWTMIKGEWNAIRHFYVAQSLYILNNWWTNFYNAVGPAGSLAVDNIGTIIETIDPPKETGVELYKIMSALVFAVAFIPIPELEGLGQAAAGAITRSITQNIVNAGKQFPTVAHTIWPEGTVNSQIEQWAELSSSIGTIVQQIQHSYAQFLPAVVNDVDVCATIFEGGPFSSTLPNVENMQRSMVIGLNTFLVSQAYIDNGFFFTRTLDTDIHALQTNGSHSGLVIDKACQGGYNSDGTCGAFWYDKSTKSTFGIVKPDKFSWNASSDMALWFAKPNGTVFTTPEMLFGGAAKCGGGPLETTAQFAAGFSQNPSLTPLCLANVTVCTWSLTRPEDFSTERTDTNAAFQDCKATDVIPNYDSYACGKGATFPVPNSYIGWANVDPPKQSMHDLIKDGRFGICQDNVVNSDAGLKH